MSALRRPRVRSGGKRTKMALLAVFAALTFALLHARGMGEAANRSAAWGTPPVGAAPRPP